METIIKKLIKLLIISFMFTSMAMAEDISSEVSDFNLSLIAGTYKGNVFNAGVMAPVLTSFFLNDAGHITGQYLMYEDAEEAGGKLSNFRSEGSHILIADWRDKYGTGILRMDFSADHQKFQGAWGVSDAEPSMDWDGVKQ